MKEESELEILKAQLEIQGVELERVSLEIHDNAGQMLSLVKLNLNVLETRMSLNNPDLKLVTETKALVTDIIKDLRNLSKSLSTGMVERYGLIQALKLETERIQITEKNISQVIVKGASLRFQQNIEIILFRIIQECLQNIVKHSKAKEIEINLDFSTADQLKIEVKDNGVGFDPANFIGTKNKDESGIAILFRRAKLIGASLDIQSVLGQGSCIKIILPLSSNMSVKN